MNIESTINQATGSQESNKRCKDKAYIVLLGLSGAGKSTTLNLLFDRDRMSASQDTSKSEFGSQTQEVVEYQIGVPENDNGSCKEIIVVDTPGFFDVNEANHKIKDAKIMATLETYLASHPDLSNCFPNVVLLIVNFNDVRVYDNDSYFVQFLRALENLNFNQNLIDTNTFSCNLVLVLTHFMSATEYLQPANNRISLQTNPEPRIRFLTGLIKTFTSITSNIPVVLAENKGTEFNLLEFNGHFRLPTGDVYPSNLFRAIEKVAINCGDKVDKSIFLTAFRDPLEFEKRCIKVVPLVKENSLECIKFSYILNEITLETQETSMTQCLQDIWNKLPDTDTAGYDIFLQVLKATFVHENIESEFDIPETPKEVLKLLQKLPQNIGIEKVVRRIGIIPPRLGEWSFAVGSFYNIATESVCTLSPFNSTVSKITLSGFDAPSHIQIEVVHNAVLKTLTVVKTHATPDAYAANFWQNRGVHFLPGREIDSMSKLLDGHNLHGIKPLCNEINGIKEFREYSIFVSDHYKISQTYYEEVKSMPAYSNKTRTEWENHIRKYGSHVLQAAYLGGYIKVVGRIDDDRNAANVALAYEIIQNILVNIGVSENYSAHTKLPGWSFQIEYHGGDANLPRPSLGRLFGPGGIERFSAWRDSLKMHSILLSSDQLLQHVSFYLKKDPQLAEVLSTATRNIVGIEYVDINQPGPQMESKKCNIL